MANIELTLTPASPTGSMIFTLGAPGPQGIPGPAGAQGIPGVPGDPGVGVPVGGTTGQYLVKATNADYETEWASLSLAGYALESWVTTYFYPRTGNPDGFATQAWVTSQNYLTIGSLAGYATQAWVNNELTIYATQSWVTGQGYITASALSPYLTSATAASTYAVIAAGQPTSGTVGQVLTKSSGTNYDSSWQTLIPGDRYLTTSSTSNVVSNGNKTFTVGTGLSYTTQQDVTIAYDPSNHMHGLVLTYNSGTGVMTVDVQQHTGTGTFSSWTVNVGGTVPVASIVWGDITGTLGNQSDLATALNDKLEVSTAASTYFTIASAAGKANLSGATFTGKLNVNAGGTTVPLNIGTSVSPSATVNGDVWMASTTISYRDSTGTVRTLAASSLANTFSASQIIDTSSAASALRVTQRGTGNAIQVEDSTTPDATAFVVDLHGKVGIGVAPDATAALKVDTNGIMFGDGTTQTTASGGGLITSVTSPLSVTSGDLSVDLSAYLPLAGGAMTGAITNTFNGMATEVSEQKFRVGLTSASLFAELNYQALTITNFGSNMIVTPFGLTFPDATIQTTAGYPNSNPSGFMTSGDVAANYYPLSNPSGFIGTAPSDGSYYAMLNANWTAFSPISNPGFTNSVWTGNTYVSASVTNIYDTGSSQYYNVLTF